jgi:hypothetical protein
MIADCHHESQRVMAEDADARLRIFTEKISTVSQTQLARGTVDLTRKIDITNLAT